MPYQNNPAGRLHHVLQKARAGANAAGRDVWKQALGVDDNANPSTLLHRMARVVALPSAVRRETQQLAHVVEDPDALVTRLPEIERALGVFFSNDRGWLQKTITEAAMEQLAIVSELLSAQRPQPFLDDEQLQDLAAELESIKTALQDAAGMDGDLRDSLIEHVDAMIDAIGVAPINGLADILDGAEATVGFVVSRAATDHSVISHPAVKRTLGLAIRLCVASATLSGMLALPQNIATVSHWVDELRVPAVQIAEQPNPSLLPPAFEPGASDTQTPSSRGKGSASSAEPQ